MMKKFGKKYCPQIRGPVFALSPLDSLLHHSKRALDCDWTCSILGFGRKQPCKAPFVLALLAVRRREILTKCLFPPLSPFLNYFKTP